MSTKISTALVSAKNPLFVSPKDNNGITKFILNAYSASEFETKCKLVTYSINFQRYYLFNNPPGDKGHPWQQNLFANMIKYQPINTIEWVNTIDEITGKTVGIIQESMDGQQRTKTYLDVRDNKVRLPIGTTIFVDGVETNVSNQNFKELWQNHREYVENWLNTYTFIVIESNLTKKEKHKRFVDVNSQNILSDQDVRSSFDNALTDVLNPMVLGITPSYNFLKVDTDRMEFYHMPKLSVEGKTIQEVISKVLVYGFADRWVNIGKNRIDTLYEDFNDGTKTKKDMDKIFPILHEVMSTTNFVIENSKSKDFWKKRDIMILMIIIWDLARTKKKFDSTLLRGGYMKVISDLKNKNSKLNDWAIENGYLVKNAKHEDNQLPESIRERDNTFASTYVAGDSPITLQFVIETIKSKLFEVGIIKSRDGRRVFTKEEKQQKAHLQDCECACCHEPIDVDNTSSYEGDHIIPHSEGGKTELSNCEALCIECHQLKTTQFKSYKKLREKYNSLSTK